MKGPLESYFYLFVNLGFLALYVFIKVAILFSRQARHPASNQAEPKLSKAMLLFYEEKHGILRVKAEWRFAQQVFLYSSFVTGLMLMVYIVCTFKVEFRPFLAYVPDYLALVFLIFVECAWFLSIEKGTEKLNTQKADDHARQSVSCEALYNEYLRLWPDQILQTGILHHAAENTGKQTTPSNLVDLANGLLLGEHLLVKEGMFFSISNLLFPAIYRMMLMNKRFILIVETQDELEACMKWFHRGMEEVGAPAFAWTAASAGQALEGNKEVNLLVVQVHELLTEQLIDYIQTEYVQQQQSEIVVMLIEGARLCSRYGNALKQFSRRLNVLHTDDAISRKLPQYVVFTEWAEELEDVMQTLFHTTPRSISITRSRTHTFYYAAVAQEKRKLQKDIMSGMTEYRIPYDAVEHLVMIYHDASRNLIHALGQWLSSGKQNVLTVVVSPPYLLRDYLAANAAFFMENNRKLVPLIPKPAMNRKTAFLYMIDHLSRAWVTSEEIQPYLSAAGIEDSSIWEGVHRYLREQGGSSFHGLRLETRVVKRFVRTESDYAFKEIVLFRLSGDPIENCKEHGASKYFAVQLQSGQTITHLLGDHLYQSYLPGQVVTFNGSWYRISRIDPQLYRMELTRETLTGSHFYKQSRTYAIRKDSMCQPNSGTTRRMIDRFEISFRNELRSFDVYTNGYFDFDNGINLHSDKVVYVPLSKEDYGYRRSYTQGSLLVLTIHSLDGEFEHADRLAFTLSYLLNELFVSTFPHNHAHIAACTPISESFLQGLDFVGDRLCRYVPRMKEDGLNKNNSDTLQLYIFEDSTLSLGLLESVVQHWEHLLGILEDYLYWDMEENNPVAREERYVCHGSTLPHPLFSFEELLSYIRRWLPEDSLRELRTRDSKKTSRNVQGEQILFAANRNGRSRAVRAEKLHKVTAIQTKHHDEVVATMEELKEIYREVRTVMSVRLKLAARDGVRLSFVSAQALTSISGIPVVPRVEKPLRLYGQALQGDQGTMHLYISTEATRVNAIAAMAHELTHIWQYDHLRMDAIPREKLEGHAMWVEISILESLGYSVEADRLREGLGDRTDIYGKGFRMLMAKLEEEASFSNPFALMLSMYGRVAV